MLATFLLCVTAVLAYLLGNLNGAIITSRLFYKKDVRNYGSGNAGLTNFYRTFGAAGVGMVIAVDVVKSILAISIGWALLAIVGEGTVGRIFAGFCLMLGHAFPVLYGFRGGKCALCGVVLTFMTHPAIGLIVAVVAAVIVIFTRYVSLASIVGAAIYPLLVWIFGMGFIEGLVGLFAALLLIFQHRGNIVRLIQGKESRLKLGKRPEQKLEEDPF